MIIEKEAIRELAIFNTSCPSIRIKSIENAKHIINCVLLGEDMNLDVFLDNFPEKNLVFHNYKLLESFAESLNVEEIDKTTIRKFFGGSFHMEMIVSQMKGLELNENFKNQYLFGHMLIPLELKRKEPLVSGKYFVSGRAITVSGLVAHSEKFSNGIDDLCVGREYLVHFATIIGPAEEKMTNWLKREHSGNEEFLSVISKLKEINYQNFWDLKAWTEDMLKQCGY